MNYHLTADVAKKEKGQQPRVYFVSSGEMMGQVMEKLQLSYMQETCEHYLAYVKVSQFNLFLGCNLLEFFLNIWILNNKISYIWLGMLLVIVFQTGKRKLLSGWFGIPSPWVINQSLYLLTFRTVFKDYLFGCTILI